MLIDKQYTTGAQEKILKSIKNKKVSYEKKRKNN